jgi:predicted nucleotidyltransferase
MSSRNEGALLSLYREAASEFATRIRGRFLNDIHSIVLYGSVARGNATEESDVDVLVLRDNGRPNREEMIEISEEIDFENAYRTFLIATGMTPQKLVELARDGFPIASAILSEGEALYDDGTFERIRQDTAGEG